MHWVEEMAVYLVESLVAPTAVRWADWKDGHSVVHSVATMAVQKAALWGRTMAAWMAESSAGVMAARMVACLAAAMAATTGVHSAETTVDAKAAWSALR